MRKLWFGLAVAVALLAVPTPALAAGVGFSAPKFRVLNVSGSTGNATSIGGSVQVIGTNFSIGKLSVGTGLDYAYTRNFGAGTNYSFFDLDLGVGVPFAVTPSLYVQPAVDGHMLMWVASPEGLNSPSFGAAPRLTVGYRPQANIAVELSASQTFLFGLTSARGSQQGNMTTIELGGTYSF